MKTLSKQQKNVEIKLVFTLLILIVLNLSVKAQDTIVLITGQKIPAKVLEVGIEDIQYQKFPVNRSPVYRKNKSDINIIYFENGTFTALTPINDDVVMGVKVFEENDNQVSFGGPRLGLTIMAGGVADRMDLAGIAPVITQFGWQFETRFFTTPEGLSGLFEVVPMIGGMEQGQFLSSLSLLVGLRNERKNIFEFGVGPNFTLSRYGAGIGMIFAAGTSLKSGKVYFPLTVSVAPDFVDPGVKLSLTVGFNSKNKSN